VLKTVEPLDGINVDLMLAWRSQPENPACAAVLEVLEAESRQAS
jgi:hypothetical protein